MLSTVTFQVQYKGFRVSQLSIFPYKEILCIYKHHLDILVSLFGNWAPGTRKGKAHPFDYYYYNECKILMLPPPQLWLLLEPMKLKKSQALIVPDWWK